MPCTDMLSAKPAYGEHVRDTHQLVVISRGLIVFYSKSWLFLLLQVQVILA